MKIDLEKFDKILDEVDNREPDLELTEQLNTSKVRQSITDFYARCALSIGQGNEDGIQAGCNASFQDGFATGLAYTKEMKENV